ncbi:MAG TPA: ATP-binding cassette domain-containing protein, partial [Stellaceae bacterium]|nr:ATP-binding cassette domain-containing protein [Stellaceae bacterium]
MTLLAVRNLRVLFRTEAGEVAAVDDVSFDVAEGEVLGIVGESGSGKSVTALSIMGLLPSPPARIGGGSVVFQGRELLGLGERAMRSIRGPGIGMIFQEP